MTAIEAQLAFPDAAFATEDHLIAADDQGISLFLRNKRPRGLTSFSAERTLLFVHGGSQAAEVTFDLRLDGFSWADWIAAHGWDVWLVDVRGFGRSTRPPEMELAPEAAPPVARTEEAWRDFGAAVRFIREARGIGRLSALGWSWGTVIAGGWTARHPGAIRRLVLFGPAWDVALPVPAAGYVRWTSREAFARLTSGIPESHRGALTPEAWYRAWDAATVATDEQAHDYDPPRVRSPAGALHDFAEAARTGRPLYDPSAITVPTQLVVGDWDGLTSPAGARALFAALTRAPEKQLVEIGGASHFAHLERTRLQLFAAVQAFLELP